MKSLAFVALVGFAASAAAPAQQLIHRSILAPVPFTETDALTPLTPWPDLAPNAATPRFMPLGGPAFPLGDLSMDDATGLIWETDGFLIQATPNGRYPALAAPFPPSPAFLPPLTGLAVNSAAGVLYVTDGVLLFTLAAAPPFAFAAPPVPLAFPAVAPPYTGLDYDPIAGLIYACDAGGFVYYFTTLGVPSGPNPVFAPPPGLGPVTDLAARPAIVVGMFVQVLGLGVLDYTSGALQPAPMTGIPPGTEGGLAYHSHPANLPGACPCTVPVFGPMIAGVTATATIGSAAFGFSLAGAAPASAVLFGLDFGGAPLPIGGGCTFWLPFPPALLLTVPTTAAGTALVPLAIPPLPFLVGLTAYAQWAGTCSSAPSGFVLSDALRATIGMP
jgi:hypothetical protein